MSDYNDKVEMQDLADYLYRIAAGLNISLESVINKTVATFKTSETERVANENIRVANENVRVSNENDRKAVMGNLVECLKEIQDIVSVPSPPFDPPKQPEQGQQGQITFPVGAVYISFDSTAPASIFGGIWEAIENGRFLRANSKASGTTGGTERHIHEMWMATANMNVDNVGNLNYKTGYSYNKDHMFMNYTYDKSVNLSTAASDVQGEDFVGVQVTGITNDANSVPPYVTVYMWRRVA